MTKEQWHALNIGDRVQGRLGRAIITKLIDDGDLRDIMATYEDDPDNLCSGQNIRASNYTSFELIEEAVEEQPEPTEEPRPAPVQTSALKTVPTEIAPGAGRLEMVPLERITPSATNPRRHFDPIETNELVRSIEAHGILQPIVVRPSNIVNPATAESCVEIVAGERRYKAAALAGLQEIPCIVRVLSDEDVLELQLIENSQRVDVDPLDEAYAFRRLMDSKRYGTGNAAAHALAQKIGKSASYIWGRMKLLDLVPEARAMLESGQITASHAILIARLAESDQEQALKHVQTDGLGRPREDGAPSVADLARFIRDYIVRDLGRAPWNLDDADLYPDAGPCTGCVDCSRTDGALFGELPTAPAKCLNSKCFAEKYRLSEAKKAEAAVEKVFPTEPTEPARELLNRDHQSTATPSGKDGLSESEVRERDAFSRITVLERVASELLEEMDASQIMFHVVPYLIARVLRESRLAGTISKLTGYPVTLESLERVTPTGLARLAIMALIAEDLQAGACKGPTLDHFARLAKVNVVDVRREAYDEWKPGQKVTSGKAGAS